MAHKTETETPTKRDVKTGKAARVRGGGTIPGPAAPPPTEVEEDDLGPKPRPDMQTDDLGKLAQHYLHQAEEVEKTLTDRAPEAIILKFRAGQAFAFLRDRLKPLKQWTIWQTEHGLKVMTVNEAIRFFLSAKTEDAVMGLKVTEGMVKYGAVKPKKPKGDPTPDDLVKSLAKQVKGLEDTLEKLQAADLQRKQEKEVSRLIEDAQDILDEAMPTFRSEKRSR